jgi:hypothetical protein
MEIRKIQELISLHPSCFNAMSSNKKSKNPNWLEFFLNEDTLDYLDNELLNIHIIGAGSVAPNMMLF